METARASGAYAAPCEQGVRAGESGGMCGRQPGEKYQTDKRADVSARELARLSVVLEDSGTCRAARRHSIAESRTW